MAQTLEINYSKNGWKLKQVDILNMARRGLFYDTLDFFEFERGQLQKLLIPEILKIFAKTVIAELTMKIFPKL
jgi:hypothetical protein